jgi:hypothetical protein
MRYIHSGSGIDSSLPRESLCLFLCGDPRLRIFWLRRKRGRSTDTIGARLRCMAGLIHRATPTHPHKHSTPQQELVCTIWPGRGRSDRPVGGGNGLCCIGCLYLGAFDKRRQHTSSLLATPEPTGANQRTDHPGGRVQGGKGAPTRISEGSRPFLLLHPWRCPDAPGAGNTR